MWRQAVAVVAGTYWTLELHNSLPELGTHTAHPAEHLLPYTSSRGRLQVICMVLQPGRHAGSHCLQRCVCLCVACAVLQRVFRLPDLWVRPGLGGKGRKMPGTLEAHQNGFRWVGPCPGQIHVHSEGVDRLTAA